METNYFSAHIDLDSPKTLLRFYGLDRSKFSDQKLDDFLCLTLNRSLELFNKTNIKATFFVIGDEIARCPNAQQVLKSAVSAGHELANHSYSHPFNLETFSEEEVKQEIAKATEIITSIAGKKPIGFRAPGASMSNIVLKQLKEQGYLYDSSAFWSSLTGMMKRLVRSKSSNDRESNFGSVTSSLPTKPYFPAMDNWQCPANENSIVEFPIPRTERLGLPFYANFHLKVPMTFKNGLQSLSSPYIPYLFHAIEFCDLSDGIPSSLARHPNVKSSFSKKKVKMDQFLKLLLERRACITSEKLVHNPKLLEQITTQ